MGDESNGIKIKKLAVSKMHFNTCLFVFIEIIRKH